MAVLDHIGIAVRSIDERLAVYRALGVEAAGREEVPSERVRVAFLPLGDTRIELLEPTAADSPIAGFIERRGEGVHHLCIEVDDVRLAMAKARAAGLTLLSDEPSPGADGAQVCFVHPRSTGGVLIELSQRTTGGRS